MDRAVIDSGLDRRPPRRDRRQDRPAPLPDRDPVAIGFVIAFGLAVWSIRRALGLGADHRVTGILYTIPSLALFAPSFRSPACRC